MALANVTEATFWLKRRKWMRKIAIFIYVFWVGTMLSTIYCSSAHGELIDIYPEVKEEVTFVEKPIVQEKEKFVIPDPGYSVDELKLLALVTLAEAEGESEKGKRLVMDTILNRVESESFPNTIEEVVYQDNQFSVVASGQLERMILDGETYKLAVEEAFNKVNSDVLYFTAGKYGAYGTPMFQEGNHYFSGK